jgi:hypothetical protein
MTYIKTYIHAYLFTYIYVALSGLYHLGTYFIIACGAQGGSGFHIRTNTGGSGGCISATITVDHSSTWTIAVGGRGRDCSNIVDPLLTTPTTTIVNHGGWNGGGNAFYHNGYCGGGGGGASVIRSNGTDIVLVAGGGGGAGKIYICLYKII